MPYKDPHRKRTILMPESRSRQIALAAAATGVSSEQFIQGAITAALLTLAEQDKTFALALMRGVLPWDAIERIVTQTFENAES